MTKIARRANDVVTKRMDLPLEVRSVDMRKREIRGWATTPTPDRMGDVVVPQGAKISLPLPLLWQHDHRQPIGRVTKADVSAKGIYITATFAEGVGHADEAWAMIQADLVTSMSIGFRALESEPLKGGGRKFTSWELLEISAVTVPAHPDAKIERADAAKPRERGSVKLLKRPEVPCFVGPDADKKRAAALWEQRRWDNAVLQATHPGSVPILPRRRGVRITPRGE